MLKETDVETMLRIGKIFRAALTPSRSKDQSGTTIHCERLWCVQQGKRTANEVLPGILDDLKVHAGFRAIGRVINRIARCRSKPTSGELRWERDSNPRCVKRTPDETWCYRPLSHPRRCRAIDNCGNGFSQYIQRRGIWLTQTRFSSQQQPLAGLPFHAGAPGAAARPVGGVMSAQRRSFRSPDRPR